MKSSRVAKLNVSIDPIRPFSFCSMNTASGYKMSLHILGSFAYPPKTVYSFRGDMQKTLIGYANSVSRLVSSGFSSSFFSRCLVNHSSRNRKRASISCVI